LVSKKGFNSSLRPIFIYDIVGMEWSDDSFFSFLLISQSIGVTSGLIISAFIYDSISRAEYIFYLAGGCLVLGGLMMVPGRKLRSHFKKSYIKINRYYLRRRK
jgi:hypothetical protein